MVGFWRGGGECAVAANANERGTILKVAMSVCCCGSGLLTGDGRLVATRGEDAGLVALRGVVCGVGAFACDLWAGCGWRRRARRSAFDQYSTP